MLAIIVAASIVAVVPLIFLWPHVGILAWYWFGMMNPHRLIWGVLEHQRYAVLIGAVTLIAWLLSRENKRLPTHPVTVLLGIFVVWMTFTTFFALQPAHAWDAWEKAFKILVMTFVTMALITTRERLYALVWVLVISLGFFAIKGGVFTVLTGGQYHVWGPEKSFIADNNQLALALVMIIPFVVYLYMEAEHRLVRLGLIFTGVCCVFSVIGTQSRGGFLGLCIVAAYLIVRSRYRLRIGAAVLGLAVVGAAFVPGSWVERMETIQSYHEDQSAISRIRAWTFATKVALDNPLTGGGFNVQFDEAYFMRLVPDAVKNRDFHSAYFEVLGEHGFIGLGLFLSLLLATWLSFSRLIRTTKSDAGLRWIHDLARMAQVSLLGYATCGAFLNLAFYDLFYVVVAMAPILWRIVAAEQTKEAAEPRTRTAYGRPARV